MKQEALETEFGKTLVIEGFDSVTTTIGLTPNGMLNIDCILIKNCLGSGEDAAILSSTNGLFFNAL